MSDIRISDEQVEEIVAALLASDANITLAYDDAGDALTIGLDAAIAADSVDVGTLANYTPQTAAPSTPSAGDVALADGTNWDPDADGNAEKVIYNGTSWVEDVDLGTAL